MGDGDGCRREGVVGDGVVEQAKGGGEAEVLIVVVGDGKGRGMGLRAGQAVVLSGL